MTHVRRFLDLSTAHLALEAGGHVGKVVLTAC